ncbi:AGC family protein kinase [Histomonas meleagridis]|uniref:AGC family protein kinase n=1 Tax=Histomonas meleagridis TaxID=135588 RepID=UPI0035599D0B|nr:AGC family protein kinase [Histomonas meleagridis]KAH0796646.1 AGC family protein kinase [Histomonas meleagridis]
MKNVSQYNFVLADCLKKKGSKFGFWHKRYCGLTTSQLIVSKSESFKVPERIIDITPKTQIEFEKRDRMPRFHIMPENERPICLASDDLDLIMKWTNELRNITLQTPDINMDCFDIISVLGRGYYGKVMLCKKKNTEEYYAIKTVHKNRLVKSNKVHTVFTERNVLMKARHPFIVNICFTFQTDSKVYLGLEYVAGGELFHHLQKKGRLPLSEVRLYVAELSLAINYLHVLHIIYRDLKPENVLLDLQGHVKLTDFGLAKSLQEFESSTGTFCGTSEYLAPEIILKQQYGPMIDWWAIGILTYELLFGETPFYHQNKSQMFHAILHAQPRFPRKTDKDTINFITGLLQKDPNKRFDFDNIMKHKFFNGMDFNDVLARKYQPEFVPTSKNPVASNFDTEYTMENPQDSLATPAPFADGAFDGFSMIAGYEPSDSSDVIEDLGNMSATLM